MPSNIIQVTKLHNVHDILAEYFSKLRLLCIILGYHQPLRKTGKGRALRLQMEINSSSAPDTGRAR